MHHTTHPRVRTSLFLACLLAAVLLSVAPAQAASPVAGKAETVWSPRLAYLLTNGETRAQLSSMLHLTSAQDARLRTAGRRLYAAQMAIQKRSDLIVMNGALSTQEKRRLIASTGYNEQLRSAESSAIVEIVSILGVSKQELDKASDSVFQADAAVHRLDAAVSSMTPAAVVGASVGSYKAYATWFSDPDTYLETRNITTYVALPDKYLKFANRDSEYHSGYPDGYYSVDLYWDGIHRGRDGKGTTTKAAPHSLSGVGVYDVGPWNVDDNWWNSKDDPARPRRIFKDLPIGMPEAQAAYFNHYNRPSTIPAHTTDPENYWDKPRGADGGWSGADQFGRQVVSPAAIDLSTECARRLGLEDSEWIDFTPLWESKLQVDGPVYITPGPYLMGQKIGIWYRVKNTGGLAGEWDTTEYSLKTSDGVFRSAGPPITGIWLAPGDSRWVAYYKILDTAGTWTGYPAAHRGGAWSAIGSGMTFTVGARGTQRISGDSRFSTAVAISKKAFPTGAPTVVLATGRNYPDALAGAALAGAEHGPLLLTDATLPGVVETEIRRLKPSKIVVLGGISVLPGSLVDYLGSQIASDVVRIGGVDRFQTAREIALSIKAERGGAIPDHTAFIVTGYGFPDALSASPIASVKGWPILPVTRDAIPTETATSLSELGITRTIVLGGENVIGKGVFGKLPAPTRIAGPDRYETAGRVADFALANGFGATYVGLASGAVFPDALAGGVLAGKQGGIMLLTPPNGLAGAARSRLAAKRTVTTTLAVYGGPVAVPSQVVWAAQTALQ